MASPAPRMSMLARVRRGWVPQVQVRRHGDVQYPRLPSREDVPPGENPSFGVDLPPMPKSYYDGYLAKRIQECQPRELTDAWLGLPDSATVRQQLPEAWQTEPLEALKDKNADLNLVSKCLEAHVATLHGRGESKTQMKAVYASQMVGTRALHWVLASQAYDKYDLLKARTLFKYLAHSIVAQDADEYMWQLLHTNHAPLVVSEKMPPAMWKGMILQQLVWARMFWSENPRAFGRADIVSGHWAPGDSAKASRAVDLRWIAVRDFQRFIASKQVWDNIDLDAGFKTMFECLENPSGRDPFPFLAFLRKHSNGFHDKPELHDKLLQPGSRSAMGTYMSILKASKALQREGRTLDAHWVIDFGRVHMPDLFPLGYDRERKPPKEITLLRRLPTPSEIQRGIKLDQDGYVPYNSSLTSFMSSRDRELRLPRPHPETKKKRIVRKMTSSAGTKAIKPSQVSDRHGRAP